MLVLSRKLNEKIVLPTLNITIQVVGMKGSSVSLGIDAPPEVRVLRQEVLDRMSEWESAEIPAQRRVGDAVVLKNMGRELSNGLQATAVGLGLLGLQLDAGLTEEARATLTCIQDDLQLLRFGLDGELDNLRSSVPASSRKSQRALLVEDNRNERELLAGFLRQSGLNVDTAGDGSDALDYLGSHEKPDVILLDMALPGVDGPTVVRQLRSNPSFDGLKIFGVSGYLPEEFGLESGPRGIDRWFHKPLDPAAFLHDLAEELYCPPA